jgi:hypothetical protein
MYGKIKTVRKYILNGDDKMKNPRIIVQDEEGYFRLLEANDNVYDEVLSKTRAASKEEAKEIFISRGYVLEA